MSKNIKKCHEMKKSTNISNKNSFIKIVYLTLKFFYN